jgi:hypothetical protein
LLPLHGVLTSLIHLTPEVQAHGGPKVPSKEWSIHIATGGEIEAEEPSRQTDPVPGIDESRWGHLFPMERRQTWMAPARSEINLDPVESVSPCRSGSQSIFALDL